MRNVMIQNQLNFTWLGFQFVEDQPVAQNTARRPNYWKWIDDSIMEHQGCFDDWAQSPSRMDMELEVTQLLTKITIDDCKARCQRENENKPAFERFLVAGLQDGNKCFCSKYFGKFGPIDSCTVPCKDNANEKCGGYGRNSVVYLSGSYGPWYYKQPNSHRGSPQACAVTSNYHQMKMGDENCENIYDYLCELPTSFCNGNGNYYLRNGTCIFVGTSKNWFDSRNDCIERGGDLLIFKDDLTRTTIMKMVSADDLNLDNDAKFWLGLTKWRWRIHGRNDGPELKYSNFHSSVWGNDPQSTNLEQCIVMSAEHNYQWIWVPCTKLSITDKEYPFLCVIDLRSSTTTSTSTTVTTREPTTKSTVKSTVKPTVKTTIKTTVKTTINVPVTTVKTTTVQITSTPIPLTPGTDPNLGASTSDSSGLSKFQIALIIVLIIILIVIILAIIFCVYYRYKNKEGSVQPEDPKFDARPDAPIPQQDMYLDPKGRDKNIDIFKYNKIESLA
ncbi:DgyrCDS757 [Dimorphilus gyrociliatus]|nr:DgyrCDS757 [Dimorphilus gyrociliatus]